MDYVDINKLSLGLVHSFFFGPLAPFRQKFFDCTKFCAFCQSGRCPEDKRRALNFLILFDWNDRDPSTFPIIGKDLIHKHHFLPKALGGHSTDPMNLMHLTAWYHFCCHCALASLFDLPQLHASVRLLSSVKRMCRTREGVSNELVSNEELIWMIDDKTLQEQIEESFGRNAGWESTADPDVCLKREENHQGRQKSSAQKVSVKKEPKVTKYLISKRSPKTPPAAAPSGRTFKARVRRSASKVVCYADSSSDDEEDESDILTLRRSQRSGPRAGRERS